MSVDSPRCSGTVEDYRGLTFDVRDRALRIIGLLGLPPGYVSSNRIAWPWIRQIRTGWEGLEITLQDGRTEQVGLVTVACGFAGSRFRLECPRCRRRVCKLYYLDCPACSARNAAGLWYAAQRTSSKARKYLAMEQHPPQARRLRSTLGGEGPAKAARHVAADLCAPLFGAGPHRAELLSIPAPILIPGFDLIIE